MEIKSRSSNAVTILALAGRFDAYEAGPVDRHLQKTLAAGSSSIIVDLAGVDFVDSTALATLVKGMKRCRQHDGDLHLCCLQQPVRVIFELTRLDKVFKIFSDEEEALKAFASA